MPEHWIFFDSGATSARAARCIAHEFYRIIKYDPMKKDLIEGSEFEVFYTDEEEEVADMFSLVLLSGRSFAKNRPYPKKRSAFLRLLRKEAGLPRYLAEEDIEKLADMLYPPEPLSVLDTRVRVSDVLDIPARLDELRLLEDGWLEGQGQAPSHEGLDWMSQAFGQYYADDLQLPFLYPTEEGGIQAEWSLGPNEVTLEVDLSTHSGQWHVLNTETDADESRTLTLNEATDWKWLVGRIRQMAGGTA